MLHQKKILLGVTGGIAVYKVSALASKLTQLGAEVKVIMTESATEFVTPLTFQALTRNPVYTDTFDEKNPEKIAHIDLADWADIAVLAPATANILAKIAHGQADDMLSTTMLATQAEVYIAPAMNVHMYEHPAVIQNMKQLEQWGYHFIEPGDGYLACGYVGKGRLEEPQEIITVLERHQQKNLDMQGKKVLISGGPTKEMVDPVRFFTNRSSGKMGFALAEAAAERGADVTLVAGPVSIETQHPAIKRIDVVSAQEMYDVMNEQFTDKDIVIKSAAVADYRPKEVHASKVKKKDGDDTIVMERTEDILQKLGERKENQFLVGFAAETDSPVDYGLEKRKKKNLDAIVVNDVSREGAGFEGDTNIVSYINKAESVTELQQATKRQIAEQLLDCILQDMKDDSI
ncbi:bifunctional phosphopantothenoylcysteine decarboxylase/phosphopantothenate--cysteine ligase CoaBC [Oceanobacillus timonensis]|uniref:bifunctional phosphopantothenoylcysteine decarboxylase/phosphopantothenate--cysteine ligase CoaBC n=1 Tax=Oceanobacillus timonensis TaxID=1926285 RepID=UPI0009BBB1CC|nr:bifunctional phosphopantothenoylcysteine decarboxylase/phosphopantothenate--cysteine ligase CoaBC [Oceanobacillus timonensis]